MKSFEYIVPPTVADACSALAQYGKDATILAGGTDLLIEFRRPGACMPKVLVDISGCRELNAITATGDQVSIRPLATHSRVSHSDIVRKFAPFLAAASSVIGSPQIRNRGTVGGNIMNAAACADTVPPLLALNGMVRLQSQLGDRTIPLAGLFVKPYETSAAPDEILTDLTFTGLPPQARSCFMKLGRRNAVAISRLSIAAVLVPDEGGRIVDARIVPGAALPVWERIEAAERMLIGERPSEKLFAAAGKVVAEVMIHKIGRRWSTEYKEPVIAVMVRRALASCVTVEVKQ